jgi:hypothetical protein
MTQESFKIILLHRAIIDLIWFHWLLNCLGIFMFQLIISNIIIYRNKYVIQGRGLTPAATVYGMYLQKYSNGVENCLPMSKIASQISQIWKIWTNKCKERRGECDQRLDVVHIPPSFLYICLIRTTSNHLSHSSLLSLHVFDQNHI